MFEFRLKQKKKCPQVGSEPRISQMDIVRGRGASCAEVWWGNSAVRVPRVPGSGVETVLWPDPRWCLWASELLFIPVEVSFGDSTGEASSFKLFFSHPCSVTH